ncbi:Wadjet anti-phage system protein JetD domain-containing protein [Aeromicrobium sp. UC242_57]|uniref:Wadjet anti-phage system protein JetD domain-containing protein n=1 Tax=Aeromicrobium sp. UC242_57 TaxID=3374624 RepID=UPI0037B9A082
MTSAQAGHKKLATGSGTWATPATVTNAARKHWDNGNVLRELNVPAEQWTAFPLRVRLPGPSGNDLIENRTEVQAWSRDLRDAAAAVQGSAAAASSDCVGSSDYYSATPSKPLPGWVLVTKRRRAGVLGMQTIPASAVITTPVAALGLLGRQQAAQAATFKTLLADASSLGEACVGVALRRPFEVLEAGDQWPLLVAFAQWLMENPRPGIYVRQVPLPGLHTKVVEQHRTLLTHILDAVLPTTHRIEGPEPLTDGPTRGFRADFAERFGFISEQRSVRVRGNRAMLGLPTQWAEADAGSEHDERSGAAAMPQPKTVTARFHPTLNVPLADLSVGDVTWPIAELAKLDAPAAGVREVVVVENKISFLTTPHQEGRLVLWGAGYGAHELLAAIKWRSLVAVTYWGDLDTHGLRILDAVRATTPHVRSVLMDLATFDAHKPFWRTEPKPWTGTLAHLTEAEQRLYEVLHAGRAPALRLEQEHIAYDHVARAFDETPQQERPVRG